MASSNLLTQTSMAPKSVSQQLSATTGTAAYTAPSPGTGKVTFGVLAHTGVASATTLTSALSTGSPITALPVAALPAALASGAIVVVGSGLNSQAWVLSSGAAAGATSLTVTSQAPNFAYPIGSVVGASVNVSVAIVPSGGSYDGTHRTVSNYLLAAGDSLSLSQYLAGATLGPGDAVYVQAATANVIDVTLTVIEGT